MHPRWKKMGLIFRPEGQHGWMNSHAQVPTVLVDEQNELVRVYFASRPEQSLSLTTYVDLDIHDLSRVVYLHPDPILSPGGMGMFDEHGIMPSSVVRNGDQVFLYYSGWSRGTTLPYNNFTGLAISEDGGRTFEKFSKGPIIDRTPTELYSATSPHVHRKGENDWWMIYCSGLDWVEVDGKLEHLYDLKVARSDDGIRWDQEGNTAIGQAHMEEAITKPTVAKLGDTYAMWFCFRGAGDFRGGKNSYRIGYAESTDLIHWERRDENAGISSSDGEWDSEMIAYPAAIKIKEDYYLFYNGNDFGKDGFGIARLENFS